MTKATNSKAPAKVNGTKAPRVADGEFTIAALAKELKIDPRKARAALRASDLKHEPGSSWVFKSSEREAIVKIIKAD